MSGMRGCGQDTSQKGQEIHSATQTSRKELGEAKPHEWLGTLDGSWSVWFGAHSQTQAAPRHQCPLWSWSGA